MNDTQRGLLLIAGTAGIAAGVGKLLIALLV